MTKSEHQSTAMHVHGHLPVDTRFTAPNSYGAVGTRRPIMKKSPHPVDLNGNTHSTNGSIPAKNGGQYKLFADRQQSLPFAHYQQPNYSDYLLLHTTAGQMQQQVGYGQQHGAYAVPTHTQYNHSPVYNQSNWSGWANLNPNISSPTDNLPSPEQFHPSAESNNDVVSPNSLNALASAISTLQVSPISKSPPSASEIVDEDIDESDSEDDDQDSLQTHPNKYPVEIEYHELQHCGYRRQSTKSGPKMKQQTSSVYDPLTGLQKPQVQRIKYYQKHLVRICRCGKYSQMDGALVHGRANDCDGYEIHYSQKCKWKAYDDYKTGKRVLIRLCKCYKPF